MTNRTSKNKRNHHIIASGLVAIFAVVAAHLLSSSFAATPTNFQLPVANTVKDSVGVSVLGNFSDYEKWLGRDLKYRVTFLTYDHRRSTVDQSVEALRQRLDGQGNFFGIKQFNQARGAKPQVTTIVTVPMVPGNLENAKRECASPDPNPNVINLRCSKQNLQRGVAGEWDGFYEVIAQSIVENDLHTRFPDGRPKIVLRFGHEQGGEHYAWSAVDASDEYRTLWIRAHGIMSGIFGTRANNVLWEWNVHAGAGIEPSRNAYPGNQYVDIIGADFYDRQYAARRGGGKTFPCTSGCPPFAVGSRSDANYTEHWEWLRDMRLNQIFDFAIEKNKLFGVSEWAVNASEDTPNNYEGGGNNPLFIQRVHDWLETKTASGSGPANHKRLAYMVYFERGRSGGAEGNSFANHKLSPGDSDKSEIPNIYGVLEFNFNGVLKKTPYPDSPTRKGVTSEYLRLFGGSDSGTPPPPPSNAAPSVSVPSSLSGVAGTQIAVTGSVSDDGLPVPPGAVSLTWSKVSGPGTVTFSARTSAVTNARFSTPGTYVIRLRANDGALTRNGSVTVTVTSADAVQPPVEITPPANDVVNGDTLSLSVATNTTNPIARVELLVNGSVALSDTTAPYSFTLPVRTAAYPNGNYAVSARVVYSGGGNVVSEPVVMKIRHPDINRNNRVEITDLAALLDRWQQTGDTVVDLDDSGTVNIADLSILLARWGD